MTPQLKEKKSTVRTLVILLGHIVAWALFLVSPVFLHSFLPQYGVPNAVKLLFVIMVLVLGVIVYINYFFLIPRLLLKRKYGFYSVSIVACVAFILFAYIWTNSALGIPKTADMKKPRIESQDGRGPDSRPDFMPPNERRSGRSGPVLTPSQTLFGYAAPFPLTSFLMLFCLTSGMSLFVNWQRMESRSRGIEEEQLKTELNFLKNQVSPHFFFNALNTIYSMIETDQKGAQKVTHKLSKLMRYLVYETEKREYISLEEELEFVEHYVELTKLRLPENVQVTMSVNVENRMMSVPPLLFLTFVENAFKHGVTLRRDCFIRFRFIQNDHILRFESENTVRKESDKLPVEAGGVGMVNVQRRLELLYDSERFNLEYGEREGVYYTKLIIHED